MSFMNYIGRKVLRFENPRVVSPPARVANVPLKNILVATPMRSGTHLMIDLILNNIAEYRRTPLYTDFDACCRQFDSSPHFLDELTGNSGTIIKTHFPITKHGLRFHEKLQTLSESAIVITVKRDKNQVFQSRKKWDVMHTANTSGDLTADYERFWEFWGGSEDLCADFTDLFDKDAASGLVQRIRALTECDSNASKYRHLAPERRSHAIYINKALTRLIGRYAPRIDTTIHTKK